MKVIIKKTLYERYLNFDRLFLFGTKREITLSIKQIIPFFYLSFSVLLLQGEFNRQISYFFFFFLE